MNRKDGSFFFIEIERTVRHKAATRPLDQSGRIYQKPFNFGVEPERPNENNH